MTSGQMFTKDYFFIYFWCSISGKYNKGSQNQSCTPLSSAQFSKTELRRFPGQYSCYIVFSIVSLAAVVVEVSLKYILGHVYINHQAFWTVFGDILVRPQFKISDTMSPYNVQKTEFCPELLPIVDTVNTDTVFDWKGFFQDKCFSPTVNNAQLIIRVYVMTLLVQLPVLTTENILLQLF